MEIVMGLLIIIITLFSALIGAGVIKVMSKLISSTYHYFIIASLILPVTLSPSVTIIALAIILVLFICDQMYLIGFKTFLFVNLDGSFKAIEDAVKNDSELGKGLTINNSYVTFNNYDRKGTQEKIKALLKIKERGKRKLKFKDKIFVFGMFNIYSMLAVFRFIMVLI